MEQWLTSRSEETGTLAGLNGEEVEALLQEPLAYAGPIVHALHVATAVVVYLDKPHVYGVSEKDEPYEYCPQLQCRNTLTLIEEFINREWLNHLLNGLPYRERVVVEEAYGLTGNEQKTLKQIGQIFGISRERTMRILQNALVLLRQLAQNS